MLRDDLSASLKAALKSRDERVVSTLRLILAALKDRDIAARAKGNDEGINDDEILAMLQTMIRQRHDSIALYEQGGRLELAAREREEIGVIEQFLPRQLGDDEIRALVNEAIAETGAGGLKDIGLVMGALRGAYAGRMDFAKASGIAKEILGAG
ncbi:MAG: GatB/YqeY domain-containing protein [Alphaproteobacteria bacterium]